MKNFQKRGGLVFKQPVQAWFDAVQVHDLAKMQQVFDVYAVSVDAVDRSGWTALMYAVRNNNVQIVSWLLSKGADVGPAFNFVCRLSNFLQVAQLLYATGKITKNEITQGLVAALKGVVPVLSPCNYEMVQWLIRLGADIQFVDSQGRTMFLLACRSSSLRVVQILWQAGKFSLDIVDYQGNNALLQAIDLPSSSSSLADRKKNQIEIVVWLLSLGVDVNHKNKQGSSAWMIAAKRRHLEILEILYDTHKIDINAQDNQGDSALMYAHDLEIVNRLLSWGVDTTLQNKNHQTALRYNQRRAKECHREYCSDIDGIIAILQQAESSIG